jgi:hypothetical protein
VTLVATTATLVESWRGGGDRRMIAATALSTATAVALTAYLVRAVNIRLLRGDVPPAGPEQQHMVTTWHAANRIRLAAVAGSWLTLRRAARSAR